MAKRDTAFKKAVTDFLESQNLRVSEIPRTGSKTPDLLVEEGSPDSMLIEIKQKTHDQGELDAYFRKVDESGLASRKPMPTGYRNVLDGIVEAAVGQLTEHDPSRNLLHALWFHCEGYDADLHEQQIHATIYGTQNLWSKERPKLITCYYFRDSSFYKHAASLDTVIVSKNAEIPIYMALNSYSPRFDAIRQSKLARAFGAAAFFPQQYEDGQKTMVCESKNERRSETPTLDYLRAKYGLAHLDTINSGVLHEAVARVSHLLPS